MSQQYYDAVATIDELTVAAHAAAAAAKAKPLSGWTSEIKCEWANPWRELWTYKVRDDSGKLWSFGECGSEQTAADRAGNDLALAGYLRSIST